MASTSSWLAYKLSTNTRNLETSIKDTPQSTPLHHCRWVKGQTTEELLKTRLSAGVKLLFKVYLCSTEQQSELTYFPFEHYA